MLVTVPFEVDGCLGTEPDASDTDFPIVTQPESGSEHLPTP